MEISKANGQMDTALANISQRTSETQASLTFKPIEVKAKKAMMDSNEV